MLTTLSVTNWYGIHMAGLNLRISWRSKPHSYGPFSNRSGHWNMLTNVKKGKVIKQQGYPLISSLNKYIMGLAPTIEDNSICMEITFY